MKKTVALLALLPWLPALFPRAGGQSRRKRRVPGPSDGARAERRGPRRPAHAPAPVDGRRSRY
ncbi:MAG: hypothetical protein M0C28_42025 [Candidatus Moduliflexus flocculans]|nr:hypothetical protein [Candidatus Moduliflexus flocculans]